MKPTATGSKARWAPQAGRKAWYGLEMGRSARRTGAGAYRGGRHAHSLLSVAFRRCVRLSRNISERSSSRDSAIQPTDLRHCSEPGFSSTGRPTHIRQEGHPAKMAPVRQ